MKNKPVVLARREYLDRLCEITNQSGLPAFVIVEVLERVLNEARALAENEYQREAEAWKAQTDGDVKGGDEHADQKPAATEHAG